MIDHERALDLAAAAFDFELSPADEEALTAHLETCEPCRTVAAALRTDAAALAGLDREDAPADLRQRIVDAAAESDTTPAPVPARATSPDRPNILQLPARWRQPALLLAAAAVIVAVVAGTLAWRAAPSGPDVAVVNPSNAPHGSAGPTDSGGPGSSDRPVPTNPPGPANPDLVTAFAPVAELSAVAARGGVVDLDSGFLLASVAGTPASELARRVTMRPALTLTTTTQADGRVLLTPAEPLTPGGVYRFTLAGTEGQTLDTWAFQARQPLRIVGTLPEDTQTDVPTNTGVEVTFDQDGVVEPASHMSIEPKIDGRFEQHDRVLAFVPNQPLAPATVYTVTVTSGVAVEGTGETLEADRRFQFETAAAGEVAGADMTFQFSTDLFESATAERPTISLWPFGGASEDENGEPTLPDSVQLEVYRLPDQAGAIAAFQQIRTTPRWSQWNSGDHVPTAGLTKVTGLDAHVASASGTLWTRLPEALPKGWYLVQWPSATQPAQAVLQVTDISGYLIVSTTKTLVWANDLASHTPVANAEVAGAGTSLGKTGADGVLMVDTPPGLVPDLNRTCDQACVPVVTISAGGQSTFLPATGARDPDGKGGGGGFDLGFGGDPTYWRLFNTDRSRYRQTDMVNVWGMVRDRDSGAVPDSVTISLTSSSDDGTLSPPIAQIEARPRPTGAFTGSLDLQDVPEGNYHVELVAGGKTIAETYIEVGRILKPAYRIEVVTGHRVYIAGDRIRVTATASFYEGTPVPGVELRISGVRDATATTDVTGTAIIRGIATINEEGNREDAESQSVSAQPARAEEGEIQGASRDFLVFPSMWTIQADSEVRGGRVRVSGDLNVVDRDRLEAEIARGADGWDADPRGAPVPGKTVTATFTELIPVKTQTGTTYDFVEKRVVPLYQYSQEERPAGTLRIATDGHGHFTGSIPASAADHDYTVRIAITDPDGHVAARTAYAFTGMPYSEGSVSPFLGRTDGRTEQGSSHFGIGDTIDVTMHEPDTTSGVDADPHLFYSAQLGLRDASVQASPRYATPFPAWGAPGILIGAVRFTGSGYVEGGAFGADFRATDRAITLDLQPDRSRYAPGDEVTVKVRTRDAHGRPLPATVILRAVDEKLYTIGAAGADDPLLELYLPVEAGIRATYASHRAPQARTGCCDTGGGGGDADFRDAVLFKAVDTGPDGRASVTFRLSSDLTSWHLSGSAIGAGLEAGGASTQIPVGSPFFVDASIAPEYLLADRPSIQLRGFGSGLDAGARVTFLVDSDSLGLHKSGLRGTAFEAVTVALPKLKLGNHKITITATTGSGSATRRYRVTRSFNVVASRLTRTRTSYVAPTAKGSVQGGAGLTEIVVSDAGAGKELPRLLDLASGSSARLERALAADVAASLVEERFGKGRIDPSAATFTGSTYQREDGGIGVVPYASSDLEVSALAALVAPDRFGGQALKTYLRTVLDDPKETRERRNFALVGLAGMGDAVLPQLQAAAGDAAITIRERLMLGLGAAALGDNATARSIATALAGGYGEATGGQARLRVGDNATDIASGTALMAMLMAAIGDPVAARYQAYVETNGNLETTYALHAVGYIERVLDHQPSVPASFAYEVGGKRTVIDLAPGESFRLNVTKGQLATLTIEPVGGAIGVTSTWREAINASSFEKDPDVKVSRSMSPADPRSSVLVTVDLVVKFSQNAAAGCHRLTDLVPSGLVPVSVLRELIDPETGEPIQGITYPEEQAGQRVVFCADKGQNLSTHLRYVARVITVGTYAWEPAIVESRTGPGRAAVTPSSSVTIR